MKTYSNIEKPYAFFRTAGWFPCPGWNVRNGIKPISSCQHIVLRFSFRKPDVNGEAMPFLRQKSSEFGIILSATKHAVIICVKKKHVGTRTVCWWDKPLKRWLEITWNNNFLSFNLIGLFLQNDTHADPLKVHGSATSRTGRVTIAKNTERLKRKHFVANQKG